MSKIKFAPNGIGSGEFTIAAPGTSTNRTINLPDLGGTLILSDATSGNTGIGTTTANNTLHVSGNALRIDGVNDGSGTHGECGPYLYRANGLSPDIRYFSSGGTIASPTIVTNGQNLGQIHYQPHNGTSYMQTAGIFGIVDAAPVAGVSVPTAIRFLTGTTAGIERMRIDSSGTVSIGGYISGLGTKLAMHGGIRFLTTETAANTYTGIGSIASDTVSISTSGTERMRIGTAGAINFSNLYGVTVTTPRNVFVNAAGDIGGISSIRASKTNITSMSDANWVLDLNPVMFNYRKKDEDDNFTEDFDTEKMYGLIAEDAAEVNPDICIYNEVDGQQVLASIHYDRLIAPIIQVLKDQQEMIKMLQAQVAELQGV